MLRLALGKFARARRAGAIGLIALTLTGTGYSQAFNIDLGNSQGVPADTFGAAAMQPGVWNGVQPFPSNNVLPLVDIAGNPTGVTLEVTSFSDIGEDLGPSFFGGVLPGTTGEVAALMNDLLDGGGATGTGLVELEGLTPGFYDVYVYSWAGPSRTSFQVFGEPFEEVRSGPWAGFVFGSTYAARCGSVAMDGRLAVRFTDNGYSTCNGVQVVPRSGPCPLTERCFGDGGDGAGCTDCPCGNDAAVGSAGGCLNSVGNPARLEAHGIPSVSRNQLAMFFSGGTPNSFAILASGAQGTPVNPANPCFAAQSGVPSLAFDGLRCIAADEVRHGARAIGTNGDLPETLFPIGAGFFAFVAGSWGGLNGPPQGLVSQGAFAVGSVRHFQVIYRDDATLGCGRGLNTTQAVRAEIGP